jgi:hypothetical protein
MVPLVFQDGIFDLIYPARWVLERESAQWVLYMVRVMALPDIRRMRGLGFRRPV